MKPYEKENNDGERKQPMKKVISLMLALVLVVSLCGSALAAIMDFMKSCAGRLKYQVGEATVDGDTATVPVEFTYVNAGSLMKDILTEYISQAWSLALSGADDEKLAAAFEEVFDEKTKGADFPTLTATLTIPCVQTSDGWKISSSADNSEDLSAQLLDILTSNIYGALEDFGAGLLG